MKRIEVGAGVIDSGFRCVIYVVLHNHSEKEYTVDVGDIIAQIIFEKIYLPIFTEALDFTDLTEREPHGFGNIGK